MDADDLPREISRFLGYPCPVHLAHLRLRRFRNYGRLDLRFSPGFHLLLGDNAQGKTNLLEAIYLLATLRSFRGVGSAEMAMHDRKAYFVSGKVVNDGEHEIKWYWSARLRKLSLNGQTVRRVADCFGVFRVVVLCTEDLQLVKGPASRRRRFLDLLLAQTHQAYLPLLQRYMRALRARNALLKQPVLDNTSLESFTRELLAAGEELMRYRHELTPRISPLASRAYQRIAHGAEELRLEYRPSVKRDFRLELDRSHARERTYRSTVVGPHRDELQLLVDDRPAAEFASEGQKRTLAIALKVAQADYLTGLYGSPPVLLIDDVMGELDEKRRAGLLPLLDRAYEARGQVFMTCTEENWPRELGRRLQRWEVRAGALTETGDER